MQGNATINTMLGGKIDTMQGNATISTMNEGQINALQDNASIGIMQNSATILSIDGNATIHIINNGARIVRMKAGTVGTMQGGGIERLEGGTVANMQGGLIYTMFGGTVANMQDGTISTMIGGTANFSGQSAKIEHLSGAATLGFHLYSPTNYGKLVFGSGDTTTGDHTVSILDMTGGRAVKGQDFTLELVDQSLATNNNTSYTLGNVPTRFGLYDYASHGELISDIFSVTFRSLGMNASAKRSLSAGVGSGMSAGLTQISAANNTLSKRLGDLRLTGVAADAVEGTNNGLWIRQYARHSNLDGFEHTSVDVYGLEGGYDRKLALDIPADLHLGVAVGMGWSDTSSNSADSDVSSPSVGLYGTMLLDNNWYLDAIARHHWLNIDSDVEIFGTDEDSFDDTTTALSLGLEVGKQFVWGEEEDFNYFVQPHLQYNYTHIQSYSDTVHGVDAKAKSIDSSLISTGLDAGLRFTVANGTIIEPYAKLNAKYELDGTTKVSLNDETDSWSLSGFRGEGGLGLNVHCAENVSIYAEGTYEKGRKMENVDGNMGLRLNF